MVIHTFHHQLLLVPTPMYKDGQLSITGQQFVSLWPVLHVGSLWITLVTLKCKN